MTVFFFYFLRFFVRDESGLLPEAVRSGLTGFPRNKKD